MDQGWQLPDAFGEVPAALGKLRPHAGGIETHLHPFRFQANTLQNIFHPLYPI
jgi:hypothetical protein